jgi:hypothetical protein
VATLASCLLVPSAARAQGSGSVERGIQNFDTTRSIEGKIVAIDAREGILILDYKEEKYKVEIDEKVDLKADKKTGLHKAELTLKHFEAGSRVKLTIRTSDGRLLELRLRELGQSG